MTGLWADARLAAGAGDFFLSYADGSDRLRCSNPFCTLMGTEGAYSFGTRRLEPQSDRFSVFSISTHTSLRLSSYLVLEPYYSLYVSVRFVFNEVQ